MLLIRAFVSNTKCSLLSIKTMSTKTGPLVDLFIDNDGTATLTMQRPPVNSLNLELLQEMSKSLDEVARNKAKGMILTSSFPTVFSAGLDVMEMYKPDLKRAENFWRTLQDVWLKLFGSNYVTAAAINGHAPAGGCLLAASCEYRVMVEGRYSIGANESALGMIATTWFIDTLRHIIPIRKLEYALTTGRLFSVAEALNVGLIDEAATDKADAVDKCKTFIKKFGDISTPTRLFTKQTIRAAPLVRLEKYRDQDVAAFMEHIKNPKAQETLELYIKQLKQKSVK